MSLQDPYDKLVSEIRDELLYDIRLLYPPEIVDAIVGFVVLRTIMSDEALPLKEHVAKDPLYYVNKVRRRLTR